MNILLSNDDGIESKGLIALAKVLSKEHNLLVVAPESNRSAFAHSLSIRKDIFLNKVNFIDGIRAYSISGTPVDCVKFDLLFFTDFKTDIVITGINHGINIGTDILYSGTVSGALEAGIYDLPAIAFSTPFNGDYEIAAKIAKDCMDLLVKEPYNKSLWNVNIPHDCTDLNKGYKITPLGKTKYSDSYFNVGESIYKLDGEFLDCPENAEDCDVEWFKKGFVTLTPLIIDKTDYALLNRINKDK